MKKLLAAMLVLTMLFCMAACSSTEKSDGDSLNNSQTTPETQNSQTEEQAPAQAVTYPTGTIKLVCPWAAGGSTDITARAIADVASDMLGVPVIVENREGGGSSIGTQEVANIRDGDGYTILVATINGIAVLPHTLELDYSPADFKDVGQVCERSLALIASNRSGWTDFASFVEDAKANPGKYMIAVPSGGLQHITFERLCNDAGIDVSIYPVPGDSDAITSVLSGVADLCMPGSWDAAKGQLDAGEMVALGSLSEERIEALPDVQTMKEQGYDVSVSAWTALLLPASTPDDVAAAVEEAFAQVLQSEALADMLEKNNQVPTYVAGQAHMPIIQKQYDDFKATIAGMDF